MKNALCRLVVLVAATAVLAGVATAATTSVTITNPSAGQKISSKRNPYLAVAGSVSFAPATADNTTFYLRRDGCGTSNDNPHLSLTSGTDAGDGCGLIVNAVGPAGDVDQAAFIDFPASDGMPLSLDGTREIDGQISLTGAQVGLAQVDVTLAALVDGQAVTIGSGSGSAVLDPTGSSTPVPFTIPASTSLDGADLQALDLRVHIHGPNVYSGFISLSGQSWVDMPSHTASVNKTVAVSLDDPSFTGSVPARIAGSTWSVAIPTPAIGSHTLYVRSTQGYDTSPTASQSFTVTK